MQEEPYVLVVEDDHFYANIYKTKLAKESIAARLVGNGEEAMKAAREHRPALILLDLIMPMKDGFETLKELKADPALQGVKVIVLSNLSQEEDIRRATELGAEQYIVKANVSIQDVIDTVKRFLAASV